MDGDGQKQHMPPNPPPIKWSARFSKYLWARPDLLYKDHNVQKTLTKKIRNNYIFSFVLFIILLVMPKYGSKAIDIERRKKER